MVLKNPETAIDCCSWQEILKNGGFHFKQSHIVQEKIVEYISRNFDDISWSEEFMCNIKIKLSIDMSSQE